MLGGWGSVSLAVPRTPRCTAAILWTQPAVQPAVGVCRGQQESQGSLGRTSGARQAQGSEGGACTEGCSSSQTGQPCCGHSTCVLAGGALRAALGAHAGHSVAAGGGTSAAPSLHCLALAQSRAGLGRPPHRDSGCVQAAQGWWPRSDCLLKSASAPGAPSPGLPGRRLSTRQGLGALPAGRAGTSCEAPPYSSGGCGRLWHLPSLQQPPCLWPYLATCPGRPSHPRLH